MPKTLEDKVFDLVNEGGEKLDLFGTSNSDQYPVDIFYVDMDENQKRMFEQHWLELDKMLTLKKGGISEEDIKNEMRRLEKMHRVVPMDPYNAYPASFYTDPDADKTRSFNAPFWDAKDYYDSSSTPISFQEWEENITSTTSEEIPKSLETLYDMDTWIGLSKKGPWPKVDPNKPRFGKQAHIEWLEETKNISKSEE